jgi:phage tail P2-like protein
MIKLQTASLMDILPANLQADEDLSAAAMALDAELQSLAVDISNLDLFSRFNDWTDTEVDELAWQYRPPYYDPDLPLEQKRLLVKNAIPFHRKKGTPAAVEDLITLLFGEGRVEEWFEYGGVPYHFQVTTNNADVTTTRAEEFIRAVESVKRLSAVLDRVTISQAEELGLYFGGLIQMAEEFSI